MADISLNGEFFDADFFAYREDADLAWRAQLFGWKCLYTPLAVAYHVRQVLPEKRSALPALINMHSVKNRWLMRIKNTTAHLYARHFVAITVRDVHCDCRLFAARVFFAARVCDCGPFVEAHLGEAARHHAAQTRKQRLHGRLVCRHTC